MGNTVAAEHLRPGTAHAHQIDTLGPGRPGLLDQDRIIDRGDDGLKQVGFMAVDDDIDLILLQNSPC